MKTCFLCKFEQPLTHFWVSKNGRAHAYCNTCRHERDKKYYKEHKEDIIQKVSNWNNAHKEHRSNYLKNYRLKNLLKLKMYSQRHSSHQTKLALIRYRTDPEYRKKKLSNQSKYYRKNPSKYQERNKFVRAKKPDHYRRLRADATHRRYARLMGAPIVERVNRQSIYDRDKGMCHICKKRVPLRLFTLDHLIPLSKGGNHTAVNLAVAHRSCNSRRGVGYLPAQLRLFG